MVKRRREYGGSMGGGPPDPTAGALGVRKVVGPTNQSFTASTTTDINIPVSSWAETLFNRIVVGLTITHPNISQLGASVTPAAGGNTATLFVPGSFASFANLVGPYVNDPTNLTDPDNFIYFSDFATPENALTATSAQNPNNTGYVEPPAYPGSNFIINAIYQPAIVGAFPFAQLAGGPVGDLTLTINETGGSTGTVNAVVVYLISSEFDAVRAWVWPDGIVTATQQSTNYTFQPTDVGTVVEGTGGALTFTIPPNIFSVGSVIEVFQDGTGQVTIAAGAGVTLRSDSSRIKTAGQYATIGLRQRAINEWVLSGDLG